MQQRIVSQFGSILFLSTLYLGIGNAQLIRKDLALNPQNQATTERHESAYFDFSSLNGLPDDYAKAVENYFSEAGEAIAPPWNWPNRTENTRLPRDTTKKRVPGPDLSEYPMVVRLGQPKSVPVLIQVLPDPNYLRQHFKIGPDFEEMERLSPFKWPERWQNGSDYEKFYINIEEFFVPKENCASWGIILPTPINTQNVLGGNQGSTINWQRTLCRSQGVVSYEEFNHFPEYIRRKDEAVWEGILATGLVIEDNEVLRWAALRKPDSLSPETWLAFAIIDADGAYSKKRYDIPPGSFLRPLSAPFAPTLKVSEEGLKLKRPEAPAEHNLLRLARPKSLVFKERAAKVYGEEWTLCEKHYSEVEVPAWRLSVELGSQPFRESFVISHFGQPEKGETWKVVVFATIKPKDLLQLISQLTGGECSNQSIERVKTLFEQVRNITGTAYLRPID